MNDTIVLSSKIDVISSHYNWLQEILHMQKMNVSNNNEYTFKNMFPKNINNIVLWSKDYRNFLKNEGELSNYNLSFNFTINGYSKMLEPKLPNINISVKQMEQIAKKYSEKSITWLFAPIIISTEGERSPIAKAGLSRLQMFEILCKDISSIGVRRCVVDFLTFNKNISQRFEKNKFKCHILNDRLQQEFIKKMIEISNKYNIELYTPSNFIYENIEEIYRCTYIESKLLGKPFLKDSITDLEREQIFFLEYSRINEPNMKCKHNCLYCPNNFSNKSIINTINIFNK